jgi:hypothetical protein
MYAHGELEANGGCGEKFRRMLVASARTTAAEIQARNMWD